MTHDVIMPALGMAQETGLILTWRKTLGDKVVAGDILMEVETDKAAMEVEAQVDGFLSELRASEGQEVPVGEVIAVISDSASEVMSALSKAETSEPVKKQVAAGSQPPLTIEVPGSPESFGGQDGLSEQQTPSSNKILASPKAKRLAAERDLDLGLLAKSGHPQPFRTADLEGLAAAPSLGNSLAAGSGRHAARARVAAGPFDEFCTWVASESDTAPSAVLAAFTAGSLSAVIDRQGVSVLVLAPRKQARFYVKADQTGLAQLTEGEEHGAPDIVVHDLTDTRLTDVELTSDGTPTLTVARDGDQLVVSLSASPDRLDDNDLIGCLDALAGRLDTPLRHIL